MFPGYFTPGLLLAGKTPTLPDGSLLAHASSLSLPRSSFARTKEAMESIPAYYLETLKLFLYSPLVQ